MVIPLRFPLLNSNVFPPNTTNQPPLSTIATHRLTGFGLNDDDEGRGSMLFLSPSFFLISFQLISNRIHL